MHQVPEAEYDRLMRLDAAVRRVVSQRADDLCWMDVYVELAGLVGVEFVPELIDPPERMLGNCRRFVDSLKTGGPYVPVYVEQRT